MDLQFVWIHVVLLEHSLTKFHQDRTVVQLVTHFFNVLLVVHWILFRLFLKLLFWLLVGLLHTLVKRLLSFRLFLPS